MTRSQIVRLSCILPCQPKLLVCDPLTSNKAIHYGLVARTPELDDDVVDERREARTADQRYQGMRSKRLKNRRNWLEWRSRTIEKLCGQRLDGWYQDPQDEYRCAEQSRHSGVKGQW